MNTSLDLYRLHDAIEKFFPGIGLQERDLVKEVKRGRLVITRIGNREYVSEAALKDMLELGQERKAPPDSTSSETLAAPQSGSSSMAAGRSALDALNMQAEKLRKGLPRTSRKNMKPLENIVHLSR